MKKMFILLCVMIFCLMANVYAEIPHLINYQGRFTDNDASPLEGVYAVTFRIYDVENGGAPLWQEAHSGLNIEGGIVSVMLGSITNLNLSFDKPYFLEIKVGTEVMSPRQRIASVGYALRAETAENAQSAEKIKASSSDASAGYLDNKVDNATLEVKNNIMRVKDKGIGKAQLSATFGAWESKSKDTVYRAATDGFVTAHCFSANSQVYGYTDYSNPPTTLRIQNQGPANNTHSGILMPVKKGDYYKIRIIGDSSVTSAVYWIPLGS